MLRQTYGRTDWRKDKVHSYNPLPNPWRGIKKSLRVKSLKDSFNMYTRVRDEGKTDRNKFPCRGETVQYEELTKHLKKGLCLLCGTGARAYLQPWSLLDSDQYHRIMTNYLNAFSTGRYQSLQWKHLLFNEKIIYLYDLMSLCLIVLSNGHCILAVNIDCKT